MPRLNIFAKGNLDVHDSLLCCTIGGKVQWNGINEIVRRQFPGHVVRVRHETCTWMEALAAAAGTVPPELRARNLPLGAYPLELQFSRRVFSTPSDVVILSLLSEFTMTMVRHRAEGYLLYPDGRGRLPVADQRWLQERFESLTYRDVDASISDLARVCTEVRNSVGAHVLVYNLSTVVPGERIHCYQGLAETLANRARRFNLALVELSQSLGISIVDVDAVVARGGADRLKLSPIHLTAEGYRLVTEEVVRILQDLGCFD